MQQLSITSYDGCAKYTDGIAYKKCLTFEITNLYVVYEEPVLLLSDKKMLTFRNQIQRQ